MRLLLLALLVLPACSREEPAAAVNIADNGLPTRPTPRPSPDATGPGTALGLTYLQLEDADILGPDSTELAEVHEIDADYAGRISGLRVKLKGSPTPGRMVRVAIDGLVPVPDGDEWDLRTPSTGDQLAALPTATR
jgi:hypothetical protein